LRAAVAEAHGNMTENTAKARIQETRDGLAEAREYVGNIRMRRRGEENG
jgi:hypothetical protein